MFGEALMTKVMLLSLVLLVSCNSEEAPQSPRQVGNLRDYNPISVQGNEFYSLCLKLGQKNDRLPSLSTAQAQYNFSYSQKNCTDEVMGASQDVTVTIEQMGGTYSFKPTTASNFGFTQIETPYEGSMKEICANAGALQSPLLVGSTGAVWFRMVSDDKCRPDANHYCVKLEKGSLDTRYNKYVVHTEEWIKFRLTGNNTGFFTERFLDTNANCPSGKKIQKHTVLK